MTSADPVSVRDDAHQSMVPLSRSGPSGDVPHDVGTNCIRVTHNGITVTQQMVSSCWGAIITSLLVTPLDVVKIRLQAQQKPFPRHAAFVYHNGLMDLVCICENGLNGASVSAAAAAANSNNGTGGCQLSHHPHSAAAAGNNHTAECLQYQSQVWYRRRPTVRFTGTADALVKIARYEGVSSLWSGLPPTLVMSVPATVIYFTAYDWLKYHFGYNNSNTNHLIPMCAGVLARVGAVTVISPLELLRTKLQSERLSYLQLLTSLRHSLTQDGPLSLWRGWAPTMLRDVPFSGIYWFGYEHLKSYFARHSSTSASHHATFLQSFVSGAISGTVASILTLPFDVIKTHRQIELGQLQVQHDHNKPCTSTAVLLRKVFRESGYRGLFAGIVPRVIKVAPACAIMISTYEFGKAFFRRYNERAGHG